jgi:hypothetical protein
METKTVYKYDWNGYYIGILILDDTDKSPSGRYNIPADCTNVEPPESKDGYKIKWNGDKWEYEEIPKDKEPEPPTFDELKVAKLAEVDAWTADKITGGFTSRCTGSPVRYDSDRDTQNTVSSDLNTIYLSPEKFNENFPNGYPMRGYPENANIKQLYFLTKEQLLQWNVDLGLHRGTCKQNGWVKQAQVEAALSKEDLDAIILD